MSIKIKTTNVIKLQKKKKKQCGDLGKKGSRKDLYETHQQMVFKASRLDELTWTMEAE